MNVLKTILQFLTVLARIIFPRKQKPAVGDCPCPTPLPAPAPAGKDPANPLRHPDSQPTHPELPLPPDARTGSDDHLHRRDTLALVQGHWRNTSLSQSVHAMGCCLMLTGAAGCLYKWFVV